MATLTGGKKKNHPYRLPHIAREGHLVRVVDPETNWDTSSVRAEIIHETLVSITGVN